MASRTLNNRKQRILKRILLGSGAFILLVTTIAYFGMDWAVNYFLRSVAGDVSDSVHIVKNIDSNDSGYTDTPIQSSDGKLTYEAQISPEKAKVVEESITMSDKIKVTTILLSKLNAGDVELFLNLSGDGLNIEEKKAAKKIILQKLSENEYNELITIAEKYGLSRGKTYELSLDEFSDLKPDQSQE